MSFNGSNFSIPAVGERNYGQNLTNYFIAIAAGALTKAGGNAALTSDLNLGTNFGLVAKYLKSSSTNIAQSGVIRFANNEGIAWRNAANGADITFKVNASDLLEYNGAALPTQALVDAALLLKLDKLNGVATNLNIDGYVDIDEETAPGTPAAGKVRVYGKADKKLYQKDSTGLEKLLGGGAGAGEKNYAQSPNDANANWAVSGAGIVVSTESNTVNLPDNATQTTGIKIQRASGSDYAYTRFTLDAVDYNKKLKIVKDMKFAGAANDYRVEVYSNTASNYTGTSTQLTVAPTGNLPGLYTGQVSMTFDSSGSAAPYIEVRVVGVAGTTSLYINNFLVGPGVLGQVPAVGPLALYTPVWTAATTAPTRGTIAFEKAVPYRNVSVLELDYELRQTAAGTAGSGTYYMSLPAGLSIDSTLVDIGQLHELGSGYAFNGTTEYNVKVFAQSTTLLRFSLFTAATTTTSMSNGNASFGNATLNFSFQARIPIAEWAGSGTVNMGTGAQPSYASNSSTSTATDTTSFQYGELGAAIQAFAPAGLTAVSKRVRCPYPNPKFQVVQINNGNGWSTLADSAIKFATNDGGSVYYGAKLTPVNATDYDVDFHSMALVGTAWSAIASFRWRVVFADTPAAVGYGLATVTDSGLVSKKTRGSFSATLGGAVSGSVMIKYGLVDGVATMTFPSVSIASVAATPITLDLTNMPAVLRPSVPTMDLLQIRTISNTVDVGPGYLRLPASGNGLIQAGTATTFAATGFAGWTGFSVSYTPVD